MWMATSSTSGRSISFGTSRAAPTGWSTADPRHCNCSCLRAAWKPDSTYDIRMKGVLTVSGLTTAELTLRSTRVQRIVNTTHIFASTNLTLAYSIGDRRPLVVCDSEVMRHYGPALTAYFDEHVTQGFEVMTLSRAE